MLNVKHMCVFLMKSACYCCSEGRSSLVDKHVVHARPDLTGTIPSNNMSNEIVGNTFTQTWTKETNYTLLMTNPWTG